MVDTSHSRYKNYKSACEERPVEFTWGWVKNSSPGPPCRLTLQVRPTNTVKGPWAAFGLDAQVPSVGQPRSPRFDPQQHVETYKVNGPNAPWSSPLTFPL